MAGGTSVVDLLGELDAEQVRLRGMLSGRDEALLAERPPSGKWSVLENVRHLLFAEEGHLGGFVAGGLPLSTMGLPTTPLAPKLPHVGSTPPSSVAEVLERWAAVHATIRAALMEQDTEEVRNRLGRHIKHQRSHIDGIGRLLRAAQRKSGESAARSA